VLTQIHEHHTLGQHVTRQIGSRVRADDLTAVRNGLQSRRTIHRRTEIIAVAKLRHPGMDPDPCPQRLTHSPSLGTHRQLAVDRRAHRSIRGREHRVHTIPAALDHLAAVRRDSDTQDLIVSRQGSPHRVRLQIPQPRRNLEIREQERHRAGRQLSQLTPSTTPHAPK
jgi:hypothetical protein